MGGRIASWGICAALLAAPAAAAIPARAPDGVDAAGAVPLGGESVLVLSGIPGQVVVTTAAVREVRYSSRKTDRTGSDRPVGVWIEGSTITIAPPPGETMAAGILRVSVPATLSVRAEASGGVVRIDGLTGSVAVTAKDTDVRCQNLGGSLTADVTGGVLRLLGVGSVDVRAKGASVIGETVNGALTARLQPSSTLTVNGVKQDADIEAEGSVLDLKRLDGPLRLTATGGTVSLSGARTGGDLRLAGTPLKLAECAGRLTMRTDAAVEAAKITAALDLEFDGGSLRAIAQHGAVEVRGRDAEVSIDALEGAARIGGDRIKVRLAEVGQAVEIDVIGADVAIERAKGGVQVKLERGNLTLKGIAGAITATVARGDAHLVDVAGPVHLDIDGGNAEVAWSAIAGEKDTLVSNLNGDVTARFPPGASCRVEASSKLGRIESNLPTVLVAEDGGSAQGPVGAGRRPLIRIQAGGAVNLVGGAAQAAKDPADQ